MHDRKGASGRQAKGKDWAIQAAGDGKDNRQHHDKTSVEEYREAHNQRGDAECKGRFVFAEAANHGIGKRLSTAGSLHEPADHGAESHQKRHRAKCGAEAFRHRRDNALEGYAGRKCC